MILTESIAIGLVFGFFFYEWLGLSAGGFVVPGYIALQLGDPPVLVGTLAVSILTWACVRVASRYAILFGRRRFILMVLTGFAWQWAYRMLLIRYGVFTEAPDAFGFIIPGLIANEMERQGVLPTSTALLVISVMVRLSLIALGLLQS
jgi:poly-gamma-glutamate biosynthesis protein PgsC/CapC